MRFVWIEPGSLIMGSPKDEPLNGYREDLKEHHEQQHKVTLTKGFYMAVHTVTQEQWQEIMGNNPSYFQTDKNAWGEKYPKGVKNRPVESVSWHDCQEFMKKLREKDNKPYRLPTEAEWEYCCRGGTTTPFYCGRFISTDRANYKADPFDAFAKDWKGTTPVGSFQSLGPL
jgi:formylglycine-generating enzyme required for sulfatase activity